MSALDGLNPGQWKGASKLTGVIRTIAGPGTGKTGTMASRVAYAIETGIAPESIAALTFTNKAADEMLSRIVSKIGEAGRSVFTGTYHSFFIRKVLMPNQDHEYFNNLGFKGSLFVVDEGDAKRILGQTVKSMPEGLQLMLKGFKIGDKGLEQFMSDKRAYGLSPDDAIDELRKDPGVQQTWAELKALTNDILLQNANPEHYEGIFKKIADGEPKSLDFLKSVVWSYYRKECIRVEAVDFDDVLVYANNLLRADQEIAQKLADKYQYVSLDEYQDTNHVQHEAIDQIVSKHKNGTNLFVVGDPRQSIYGFRHADVTIMTAMHEKYPDLEDVELSENYRSSRAILNATNAVARTMRGQITDGQLYTSRSIGADDPKPSLSIFEDGESEAAHIVAQLKKAVANGEDISRTAVLYRNRTVRQDFEKALIENDVQYQVVGDTSFWESKEIRDVMALLRLAIRSNDGLALYRIVENSIIPTTPLTLRKNVNKTGKSPFQELRIGGVKGKGAKAEAIREFFKRIDAVHSGMDQCDPEKQTDFHLNKAISPRLNSPVFMLNLTEDELNMVAESRNILRQTQTNAFIGVIEGLYLDYIWPKQRDDDVKKASKKAKSPSEVTEILESRLFNVRTALSLFRDQALSLKSYHTAIDELTLRAESSQQLAADSVTLMTIHASKGQEFANTYVIGCEEENFFRNGIENAPADIQDEELRNVYVALTRAEQSLHISAARFREVHGEYRSHTPLSVFSILEEHCECNNYSADSAFSNKALVEKESAQTQKPRAEEPERRTYSPASLGGVTF